MGYNKKSGYLGNPNLKEIGTQIEFTKEQVEEYIKCSNDPVYFIKKYIKIVTLDKGLEPFELYDYQENIVNTIQNNRYVIAKLPRQTGKTTTTVAWMVHYLIFNQNVNIAILANKLKTAMEIMKRLAYEQKLYIIIASTDYIYGTNYAFCHGFIGKDLTNMTQQKIIQAMGRVGRNKIQQEYTVRFRDDDIMMRLFLPQSENLEAINMNRLFSSEVL